MKILFLHLLISFLIPSDNIIGIWDTDKDNTIIEIYEQNGSYFGKIVSSDHEKAEKGTLILKDFKYQDGLWKGKFYSIKFDKVLDAEIQFKNNKIEITAFFGFLSKSAEWEKINN